MELKKATFIVLILLLLISTIFSKSPENTNGKICILLYQTPFKVQVMERIIKTLNKQRYLVHIDSYENVNKYDPQKYEAVLIMSGVKNLEPYKWSSTYLKKHNYAKNIIYFCTTANRHSAYTFDMDDSQLDAITAASEFDNVSETASRILDRLYEVIQD